MLLLILIITFLLLYYLGCYFNPYAKKYRELKNELNLSLKRNRGLLKDTEDKLKNNYAQTQTPHRPSPKR